MSSSFRVPFLNGGAGSGGCKAKTGEEGGGAEKEQGRAEGDIYIYIYMPVCSPAGCYF